MKNRKGSQIPKIIHQVWEGRNGDVPGDLLLRMAATWKKENPSWEYKLWNYYKYLGFKKNPDILKLLLMNQTPYEIPLSGNSLVFGNRKASIKITAFMSLHCSHCAKAFEKIRDMLNDKEDILVNLVLMASDNKMLFITIIGWVKKWNQ